MTYEEMKNNEEVNRAAEKGNRNLGVLGFTDHPWRTARWSPSGRPIF